MRRLAFVMLTVLLAADPARAHHVVDFVVTSSQEGGGQLIISYDFTTVVPVSFNFSLGGVSVWSGTSPGFDTADGDEFFPGSDVPYPIFPPGIPIFVELVDNDGGRTAMKVNGVTLSQPGDRALVGTSGAAPPGDLHRHPEWQTVLALPEGTFGEARITFKMTTTAPGYADSPAYGLLVSNGHLAPPEYAGDAYDRRSVQCQAAVGRAVESYVSGVYAALRGCLDAVQVFRAEEAAGRDTGRSFAAAERVCATKDVAGRAEKLRQKAFAAIQKRCGAGGSGDFDDVELGQHLGLARCRIENVVAASYFRARLYLRLFSARDGRSLDQHFPCVRQTAGEEEGPS